MRTGSFYREGCPARPGERAFRVSGHGRGSWMGRRLVAPASRGRWDRSSSSLHHRRRGRLRYKGLPLRYPGTPALQRTAAAISGTGADTVTVTVTVTGTVSDPSSPAFWDAGDADGVPASQRRTSSVVIGWVAGSSETTLLVRRRPSSEPEEPDRYALPVECPVAQLCGMYRGAEWSYLHNRVPRTSRWTSLFGGLRPSHLGVEETPGHGSDVVEEMNGVLGNRFQWSGNSQHE